MGNPSSTNVNQAGGAPTPPGSILGNVQSLSDIDSLLQGVFAPGGSQSQTDLITFTTHAVPQALYTQSKRVKKAIIQNISSTDIITLVFVQNGNGKAAIITSYNGIILNPASVANQAGGSIPTGNVDLSNCTVICDTTDGLVGLAVNYEF